MDALLVLLALNLLLIGFLIWRCWSLTQMSRLLQRELATLRCLPHDQAPDLDQLLGRGGRTVLVLDILNPMEVAARQSWFADKLGSVTAPLIRRIVYDQAVKNAYKELEKWGVQARVSLHRAA